MSIFTPGFWKAAAERAVKTFAQTEAALLLAAGTGLLESDWKASVSVSGMAAVVSLLTSIGSDAANGGDGPSFASAEVASAQVVAQTTPAGEVIAGPAAPIPDGTPVDITEA